MAPPFRLLLAVVALSLCWLPASARAKDDLVIGISQFPATLHPSLEAMMATLTVTDMAVRPLTAFDAGWQLACVLCERLPTFENGLARREPAADGRQGVALTYRLRQGLFWADGTPVGAADARFTWEVGRHPRAGIADAELYRRILDVEIKDPRTFVVHLDRLTFDYNALNDFRLLPAHVERDRFDAAPEEYRNRTAYDRDPTLAGLYNGPYRITQVVQGSHVVLEPNPHWSGPPPAFRRIVVRAVENTAALEAQLLAGAVDMVPGGLGLPLDQAVAFARRADPRFRVLFKSGLAYEHLEVNLASPLLGDRRLRRALMYAMDREQIGRQLFDGRQPVADSVVNPLDGVHADDGPRYAYDPAQAAQLLEQAGWHQRGAVRRNARGEPLIVDIMTTAGNRSRELVAQAIQGQWRRLGIDSRLRTEPARIFFGDTVPHRRFAHLALFAWISSPENVPRTTLHSTMIPSAANNWSGQNVSGYADARMDGLLDAIEGELDKDRRRILWRRLQHLYAEDLPALPLFFQTDATIVPSALHGVEPTGHQAPATLWVEHWRWRP